MGERGAFQTKECLGSWKVEWEGSVGGSWGPWQVRGCLGVFQFWDLVGAHIGNGLNEPKGSRQMGAGPYSHLAE